MRLYASPPMPIYDKLVYDKGLKQRDNRYLRTTDNYPETQTVDDNISDLELNSGLWNYYQGAIHSSGVAPVTTSGVITVNYTDTVSATGISDSSLIVRKTDNRDNGITVVAQFIHEVL